MVRADGVEVRRQVAVARGSLRRPAHRRPAADQVAPSDPELLARIRAEAARKAQAFASRADLDGFRSGFVLPLAQYRISGRFRRPAHPERRAAPAALRRRHGRPGRDARAGARRRAGSPCRLAGLHFEGGLILIDHGQGLISQYLHLSRVDVREGQMVRRGQRIGAVGKEGRATGPHLCWRLKWQGRNLDPMLLVGAQAP